MKKPENIFVSLQLEKDATSGEMLLCIQFDRNAPNFFADKNLISWCPSIEELDFVSEAFGMIAEGKRIRQEKTMDTTHRSADQLDQWGRHTDEKALMDRMMDKKDRTYVKP